MSPRSYFEPIQYAAQGIGGYQNSGIIVVKYRRTNDTYIEKRIPRAFIDAGDTAREVRALRQCMLHPNIVCIVDADLKYEKLGYGSIWMQHCELGSLDALMLRYAQHGVHLADEGFLWHVFWHVSLALCCLWTGHDNISTRRLAMAGEAPSPVRGWNAIVHRDLKPSNVFMTQPDPRSTDANGVYPTMLIGDFGCSVASADIRDDLRGQDQHFAPPEAPACSEKGDVYGVGLIIHCLALMQQAPFLSQTQLPHSLSQGLHTTVRDCLMRDPDMRPSPQDLPKLVWRGYQAWRGGRRDDGQPLPSWAFNPQY